MLKNIKRNKIKGITCMLGVLAASYSCNDLVDEEPLSEIGPNSFYTNNDQLQAGVIAAYDGMQGTYNQATFFWGEFRSDNHQPFAGGQASQNNLEIVNNDITQGNPAVRWNNLYRMIDRANQAIINAPNIPNLDESLLAEALAIRAKAYFDAVRVWGAVPLFTEPVKLLSDATKPVTDGDIIMNEVVIPDMLRAEELITPLADEFRFSKSSIYALQAEVYMWLNDYPKAKVALESLIGLGQHRLVTTAEAWDDMFYNNQPVPAVPDGRGKIQVGSELILSIRYDITEDRDFGGTRNNRSGIMGLFYAGIPSYVISETVENKWREKFPIDSLEWVTKYPTVDPVLTRTVFEDDGMGGVIEVEKPVYGDWRYYLTRQGRVDGFSSVDIGEARTAKWQQTNYSANEDDTDIALYRYADMILLLAEAENFIDLTGATSLDLVNEIRTARQLPQVSAAEFGATPEERLNYILDERQLELFGEGKRWWDLVRNNKAMEVINPIMSLRPEGVQITEDRLVWPIYVDHLIENPLLEQNTGYRN
jgi:starch-binding outer membrane protein, SusD/RagB family